jgi:hypothetical protein
MVEHLSKEAPNLASCFHLVSNEGRLSDTYSEICVSHYGQRRSIVQICPMPPIMRQVFVLIGDAIM